MPELLTAFQNDPVYPLNAYTSEWVNCSATRVVSFTAYSSSNFTMSVEWAVDDLYDVIFTDSQAVLANNSFEIIQTIRTRFCRFTITGLTPPTILRSQGFFFLYGCGDATQGDNTDLSISSVGVGSSIVKKGAPDNFELRSLISGDGSVIITQNLDEIDFSSSASPYQQIGDTITPVDSLSTNSITCGLTNSITTGALNSAVVGGNLNDVVRSLESVIIGGENNNITGDPGIPNSCLVVASDNSTLRSTNVSLTMARNAIIACDNANITAGGGNNRHRFNNLIAAGLNLDMGFTAGGRPIENSFLIGGTDNSLRSGARILNSGVIGGTNNIIEDKPSGGISPGIENSLILGGEDNSLGLINESRGNHNNVILGGLNNNISQNGIRQSVAMGSNCVTNHTGNFSFSDRAGGSSLTSTASDMFSVRSAGGARFFSNTGNVVGVSLAAGGNSWAATSDANLKENFVICDGQMCLDRLKNMEIYEYNFIGVRPEQKNIGTTSQQWHSQFPSAAVKDPIFVLGEEGEETDVQAVDEEGELLFTPEYPSKDPLKIEIMDLVGVLLACVKRLDDELDLLKQKVQILESA